MGSKPTRMTLSLVDSVVVVRISLPFDFIVRLPIDYIVQGSEQSAQWRYTFTVMELFGGMKIALSTIRQPQSLLFFLIVAIHNS